jgi:hypothetical protein
VPVKRISVRNLFLTALISVVSTNVSTAYAAPPSCDELPCSVNRNCSSTGVACRPDERECNDEARGKGLEIKCEQKCSDGPRLVHCPADTGRSDSRVVWILLSLAVVLAIGGSTVAWVVLRKKSE